MQLQKYVGCSTVMESTPFNGGHLYSPAMVYFFLHLFLNLGLEIFVSHNLC
jgi:hypothetical protein